MADDRINNAAAKRELAEKYMKQRAENEEKLKKELGADRYNFVRGRGDLNDNPYVRRLTAHLKDKRAVPSEYVRRELGWIFEGAVNKSDMDALLYCADRIRSEQYSVSYVRRSFRARSYSFYAGRLVSMIRRFGSDVCLNWPLADILLGRISEEALSYTDHNGYFGRGYNRWQVAYAIDRNDGEVQDAVKRILIEDNGCSLLTSELICGVLLSKNDELHELLGRVLLAGRLQEGLRQAICENADAGSVKAFLSILRVIDENGLIRYSSVKRAVGTWLGILSDEARDLERISAKSVRLIVECLNDAQKREEYLLGDDAMEMYVALWSYGFYSIEDALEKIGSISRDVSEHRLLVCGYFAANVDQPYAAHRIAKQVIARHTDKPAVVAVWLDSFMHNVFYYSLRSMRSGEKYRYKTWFDSTDEVREFYDVFKGLYSSLTVKKRVFSPCVFPWYEAKLERGTLAEYICFLASMAESDELTDEACSYLKVCSSFHRAPCFASLLNAPRTVTQRKCVLEALADRESSTKNEAFKAATKLVLTGDENVFIESHLRLKDATVRKNVTELLMKQKDEALSACIARLLDSSSEEVRLAALDMLVRADKEGRKTLADSFKARLADRMDDGDVTEKERLLLLSMVSNTFGSHGNVPFSRDDRYAPSEFDGKYIALCTDTFKKYFPDSNIPEAMGHGNVVRSAVKKLVSRFKDGALSTSAKQAREDLVSLASLIDEHRTYSFKTVHGGDSMLGNVRSAWEMRTLDGCLPLSELWSGWANARGIDGPRIVRAAVLAGAMGNDSRFYKSCEVYVSEIFGSGFEHAPSLQYSEVIGVVLESMMKSVSVVDLSRLAVALSAWFVGCVPDDRVIISSPLLERGVIGRLPWAHLLAHDQLGCVLSWLRSVSNDDFSKAFPISVAVAERCVDAYDRLPKQSHEADDMHYYLSFDKKSRALLAPDFGYSRYSLVAVGEYLKAAYRGIITDGQLIEFILRKECIRDSVEVITSVTSVYRERDRQISVNKAFGSVRAKTLMTAFIGDKTAYSEEDERLLSYVSGIYERVIQIIVSAEISRGDSPGEYTEAVSGIERIYGADNFVNILSAMGSDTLDRSQYYTWASVKTRRETLSRLLRVCIPLPQDSAESLKSALEGKRIKDNRLIEAAIYSPEWIPIVGRYLGIDGFESVCYYFMAHMNESFDDKRRAVIARFTPLSEEELNLGAFDADWFRGAYDGVGEKTFEVIYKAAKYISDGAKHARARKYADAALGRYGVEELESTVADKRNRDLLMAYALIPLEGEDDLLRRYTYIQAFKKESKRFGSQRMASEGKAVEMALRNLATNAGYADTMRLTLRMETKTVEDNSSFFEEQEVEGVWLKLVFDGGKAQISVSRDGKPLKSIPAKLKKHETVVALTELKKTLTEQYRRTVRMLEEAMENETVFTFGELSALSNHPVVYPILKDLVLICGDEVGFITGDGITGPGGEVHTLGCDSQLKIAHPFALYKAGVWRDCQRRLFERGIKQPFKQVFRELYIKTEDESDSYSSLRYAGNQLQPAKTASTLKSRRWVADVESGLQKVYYKENIVASIYAMADWFSPADIEAPTLEWVCFRDRRNGEQIRICDVPDVIFSEVMRDVDLAVSVAHAGGVDPEASHSTVEMRGAILSFVLPMLRIENVRIDGRHAVIDGSLAEYSVHLGSGVVHQIGGTMIPVLPIHSQHRGKVFLPFVDDDPKTAEVISKVLLFADDGKIKDPMILSKINRTV